MGLQDLLKSFQSLNMEQAVLRAVESRSSTDEFKRLNKEQLFNFGVDSDGVKLKRYVSNYYAKEKNYDNPRPGFGVPDLYVTGSFYRDFFTSVGPQKIDVSSKNEKTKGLVANYGKNIFGLTDDNTTYYAIITIRPKVVEYVEKITGLKAT